MKMGMKICSLFLLLKILQAECQLPIGGKCPDSCAAVTCLKPFCIGETVLDRCGCCSVCAKGFGENCGGDGKCGKGLSCNNGVCGCGPDQCNMDCKFGKILDKNGCPTCKCRTTPTACPKFLDCSRHYCQRGSVPVKSVGQNGCDECTCRSTAGCKPVGACFLLFCQHGTTKIRDSNGCEVCVCKNEPGIPGGGGKLNTCVFDRKIFKVGDTRPDDCNTCTCGDLGQWACTEKACVPECPTLSNCAYIKCGYGVVKSKDSNGCEVCSCKPKPKCPTLSNCAYIKCGYGVVKSKDSNGCEVCTCKPKPTDCLHNGRKYRYGASRHHDCNKCICIPNGLWACTKRNCRKGVCYCNGRAIRNRQPIFDGCNTCTCRVFSPFLIGRFSCTKRACRKGCSPNLCCTRRCPNGYVLDRKGCNTCRCKTSYCKYNGRSYRLGQRRYDQCNYCVCSLNGRWACTKRGCPKGVCYCGGKPIPNAGSYFDGCNTCTCSVGNNAVGLAACTRRACPRGCSANLCCTQKCSKGYQKDKRGCSICKCIK